MIKAVIFDLDGVIIDSELLWEKSTKIYFTKLNKTFPHGKGFQKYLNKSIRGHTQKEIIAVLKRKFGVTGTFDKILNDRLRILFKIFDKKLKLVPGTLRLLKKLGSAGYPLLLASSSPAKVVNYSLKKFKLAKYFRYIITGDEISHSKPHPEIFLKAAKMVKIPSRHLLVIEDSSSGIRAAKRAGMKCLALKQPYFTYHELKSADLIITNFKNLTIQQIRQL